MITLKKYFLFGIFLLLTACNTNRYAWQPVSYDTHIVWADDNTELLIGNTRFEQRQSLDPLMGTTTKRHFSHQLFLVNPDGSNRRALTSNRPNQLGQIYYMKQAGYVLVESLLENGVKQFHKIDLQGNERLLLEIPPIAENTCPDKSVDLNSTVIPSADGHYIAYAYLMHCQQINILFYTTDRATFADQQILTVDAGQYEVTWRKDGAFILASTTAKTAWQLLPQTPIVNTAMPRCFSPATSSSMITADGRAVSLDEKGINISAIGTYPAFGCQ
ncbi:hypothetical protein [Beggiatoa leptomitoformis]|uniref:Lipoprotein n=1 Tax=Beggiatoa leptomitoformis TaxID=288004 RepID=A0A2N9YH00_9GAMM|nr:hypothetical protein [Beggiatoa leptomitoformis]ALG67958.1 hypothetical protein AL038_09870 [Beggiatoa leptomitoformis]AUI69764.1 hypothetical protein BLE401_14410 [Beggiatoa leptomitoformis]